MVESFEEIVLALEVTVACAVQNFKTHDSMTFQKLSGVNILLPSSLLIPLYMLVVTMYVELGSQEMLVQKWSVLGSLFGF